MEWMGFKISVLLAALVGGVFRIMRIESKATSIFGKAFDKFATIVLSVTCALLFLHPFMTFFAIPFAYEAVCAATLALTSEMMVTKILELTRDFDLGKWIRAKMK